MFGQLDGIGNSVDAAVDEAGSSLSVLIMYYLLKDCSGMRRSLVAGVGPAAREDVDGFLGHSCRVLRDHGRTSRRLTLTSG